MNAREYVTPAQRRNWEEQDGQALDALIGKARTTLRLNLTADILAAQPLSRVIRIPGAGVTWSVKDLVNDRLSFPKGDAHFVEMLKIIGELAGRKFPDSLADRAAKLVDSIADDFADYYADDLAREWSDAAKPSDPARFVPLPGQRVYLEPPRIELTAEQCKAVDDTAGIAA
ncbi:hypothetical protein [Roseateles sp. PN1]|uniref:hypothetical protein n=1 Tax=Roseateles sp. PN1 TaxID=3137372 RepID=UPI0031386D07